MSHDTATSLHRRTASEAAGPASHRLLRARYLFVPLHFYLVLWHKFLMHAGGWEGENNPPFCFLGQVSSGPALMSRPGPAQTRKSRVKLLGRDRPNPFGAESDLVSWAGLAHIIIILYIIILLYIYIYIYIYIYMLTFLEKKSKKIVNFPAYFYQNCLILICIFIL